MNIKKLHAEMQTRGPFHKEDRVEIEFVFETPRSPRAIARQICRAIPQTHVRAAALTNPDVNSADRYVVVIFPLLRSTNAEWKVFDLARRLAAFIGAVDANPILTDSISGAVRVSDQRKKLAALCETDIDESLPKGWVHTILATGDAWLTTSGEGIKIGHIDTGYSDHAELDEVILIGDGWSFIEKNRDAQDRFSKAFPIANAGHGSLVASVIASRGGLGNGGQTTGPGFITGVAPMAKIVPVRAIKSVISLKQRHIPRAIRHSIDSGCDVIVMALGGPSRVAAVEEMLRYAALKGVITICAAGNCWPFPIFPAAYSLDRLAVAVAAVDAQLAPWGRTARGKAVTVSAPGENVWGARKKSANWPRTDIAPNQGTTLAASLTAGAAALWVAKHGAATLKAIACQKKTSVQELFMQAIVHNLVPPSTWNGAKDLGAGVVNFKSLFEFDPTTALTPTPTKMATRTTLEILTQQLVAEGTPYEQLDSSAALLASELVWLRYWRNAGKIQDGTLAKEDELNLQPQVSEPARVFLADRPLLRRVVLGVN